MKFERWKKYLEFVFKLKASFWTVVSLFFYITSLLIQACLKVSMDLFLILKKACILNNLKCLNIFWFSKMYGKLCMRFIYFLKKTWFFPNCFSPARYFLCCLEVFCVFCYVAMYCENFKTEICLKIGSTVYPW